MTGRPLAFAAAMAILALLVLNACSSHRTVTTSVVPSVDPSAGGTQAGEPVSGQKVTKEVPHSTESISDIKEREAKDPVPPRGDVAIHSHRIRSADNAAMTPPPSETPSGTGIPPGTSPGQTGGYQ